MEQRQINNFERNDFNLELKSSSNEIAAGMHGYTEGETLYIENFYVSPSSRGKGFGPRIVRAAEAQALKLNCNKICVSTDCPQISGFYQDLGYTLGTPPDNFSNHRGNQGFYFLEKKLG